MLTRFAQSLLASTSLPAVAQDALRGASVVAARHYHKNVSELPVGRAGW